MKRHKQEEDIKQRCRKHSRSQDGKGQGSKEIQKITGDKSKGNKYEKKDKKDD